VLHAEKDAAQVDGQHPVEVLGRILLDPVGAARDAGVVESGVQAPGFIIDALDERRDIGFGRDVNPGGRGHAARRRDQVVRFAQAALPDIGAEHVRSAARKQTCSLLPDPGTGPRHQGNFAGEVLRHGASSACASSIGELFRAPPAGHAAPRSSGRSQAPARWLPRRWRIQIRVAQQRPQNTVTATEGGRLPRTHCCFRDRPVAGGTEEAGSATRLIAALESRMGRINRRARG
jgi:hypothetical protein